MPDRLRRSSHTIIPISGETLSTTNGWSQVSEQAAHVIGYTQESGVTLDPRLTVLIRYRLMVNFASLRNARDKWKFRDQIIERFNQNAQNRYKDSSQRQEAQQQAERIASHLFTIFREDPNPNRDLLKNVINAVINPPSALKT